MPGAAPLEPRFYAVILHMGTNGLNKNLEIPNYVIFDVFVMKYDQIPHLNSIFGTVDAKFGLVGKPHVSYIDFICLNGAGFSTWAMPGAAPLDPLLRSNTAHGNKWVKPRS